MRDFLTGLAILVIVALAAALVGPFFVDWAAQRGRIEERLTQALGVPVSIEGPIEVRLLPSPRIDVRSLAVNRGGQGPTVHADRMTAELAVMPLLRGDVRIVEAFLDKPVADAALAADGSIEGLQAYAASLQSARNVAIERLVVRDGAVRLRDRSSDRLAAIEDIDGEADAQALVGPWRANGRALIGGAPLDGRGATGAPESQGVRLKLMAQAVNGHQRAEADGRILADNAGALLFDGRLTAGGRVRWPDRDGFSLRPWTFVANARLQSRGGELTQVELEAGGEDIPAKFAGSGALALGGQPRLSLALESKQIDLDKPFTLQGRPAPSPSEALGAWVNAFSMEDAGFSPPLPISATFKVGSVLLGGDVASNAEADLTAEGAGLGIDRFQAALPGAGEIQLSGRAAFTQGGRFDGHVRVAAKDASRLMGWAEAERSGRSGRLGDAKDVAAEADVSFSSAVMAARSLKLRVEKSTLQGTVRYTPPELAERGKFEAQLTSDGLAVEQAPDVSTLAAAAQGVDVSITLNARNVRVGRDKGPTVGAGRLGVKLSVTAEGLVIDSLDIADVGGASLSASGRVGEKGGRLDATVDARRVEPLAELLKKIAPGRFPGMLSARAASLSPLKLKLSATRAAGNAGPTEISVQGSAAASRVSASATLGGGATGDHVAMALKLDSPESAPFLRQLGFEALPLSGFGPGRLAVDVDGRFGNGATLRISGAAAGASVSGQGSIGQSAADPDVVGSFSVSAADVSPLLQLLALPGPDGLSRVPLQASADLSAGEERWTFSNLKGGFGAEPFSGRLVVDLQKASLEGALDLEHVVAPALAGLALGPTQPPIASSLWSSSRFAPVLTPPYPITLAIRAKGLDLGQGWTADNPSFTLNWTPEALEISRGEASFMGGRLGGGFQIRRQGGLANLSGKLTVVGVSAPALWPQSDLAGTIDGELDGAAAGESVSSLVANLSGGGNVRVRSLVIPRLDPSALPGAAASLDAEGSIADVQKVSEALAGALDRSGLQVPSLSAPVTLSNGVVRFGPVAIEGPTSIQASATYDLRSGRFEGRGALSAPAPAGWAGPSPQATVTWRKARGAAGARDIDVSLLANTLTTHAVARELEKVEAAESDLRERQFFMRRLKADRERIEREKREAEAARAAEEAKAAEDARKAEEARRAAEAKRLEEERAAEKARREGDQASGAAPVDTGASDAARILGLSSPSLANPQPPNAPAGPSQP